MIKILFVNKFQEIGGSEVFLFELLKNLDRTKYTPIVVPIGETKSEALTIFKELAVKVYPDLFRKKIQNGPNYFKPLKNLVCPQGQKSPMEISAIFRLAQIVTKESVQILFYLDKHAALNLAPAAAILSKVPFLLGSFHTPNLQFSIFEKLLFYRNDLVICTSQYHKTYLMENLKIPEEKIKVIYNGIAPDRFKTTKNTKAELKEKYKISSNSEIVGIFARLVPQKNHDLFFRSAKIILNLEPDVQFLVVGEGPLKNHLVELCSELNISSNVHFIGFQKEIGGLLSLCDVSVLSSKDEFFPYTILESMLTGIPVVTTSVGAINEMIDDCQSGMLVPPDNPEKLAESIMKILDNPKFAKRISENAQQKVKSEFSSKKMSQQIEELFNSMNSVAKR